MQNSKFKTGLRRFGLLRLLLRLLLIVPAATPAAEVYVSLTDFGLVANATNRTVLISGNSLPRGSSSSVILREKRRVDTGTNSYFWISNAVEGVYLIQVLAPPALTEFRILVTNTTAVIGANSNLAASANNTYPPDTVAYGAAASDLRFAGRGAFDNLALTAITNQETRSGITLSNVAPFVVNGLRSMTSLYVDTAKLTSTPVGKLIAESGFQGDGSGIFNLQSTNLVGTLTNNSTGNSAGATNLFDPDADQFLGAYFRQGDENIYITCGTYKSQRAIASRITPPTGPSFRDGSLFYANGRYYLASTINGFYETNKFGIAVSDNLIAWSTHLIFDCRAASNYFVGTPAIKQAWGPKWFTDSDGSNYIAVALSTNDNSTGMRAFITSATDNTLTNWTPLVMLTNSLAFDNFDGTLVKSNSQYQIWTRSAPTSYIEVHTASTIYGPWTAYKTGDWAGWGNGYEGIYVKRYGTGSWFAIIGDSAAGKQYYTTTTNDNFSGWATPTLRQDSHNFMNGGLLAIPGRDLSGQDVYSYSSGSNSTTGSRFTMGHNIENITASFYLKGGTSAIQAMGGTTDNLILTDPNNVGADFYLARRILAAEILMYNNGVDNNVRFDGTITATNGTVSSGGFVATNIASTTSLALSPWGNPDTGIEFSTINNPGILCNGVRSILFDSDDIYQAAGMYAFVPSFGSAADVAFQRDSAGVIQFNSSTAGALRDIRARTVTVTNVVLTTGIPANYVLPPTGGVSLFATNGHAWFIHNVGGVYTTNQTFTP